MHEVYISRLRHTYSLTFAGFLIHDFMGIDSLNTQDPHNWYTGMWVMSSRFNEVFLESRNKQQMFTTTTSQFLEMLSHIYLQD